MSSRFIAVKLGLETFGRGGYGVLFRKSFYIHKKCGLPWHFWENTIVEAKESQLDVCTNVQGILLNLFWKIAYLSVFWNQNRLYEANFISQSNAFLLHLFEGAYQSYKKDNSVL